MKIGGFGQIKNYLEISKAGFDFAELDIPEIAALEDAALKNFQQQTVEGIPVQIGSRLLPVSEPLFFKEGFKPESLQPYLEKACQKTALIGIQAVILGNGKARCLSTLEDYKKEPLFVESLRMMASEAKKNNQILILEPLGPKYTNYINTIEQAVQLIEKAQLENVFTMADLRHMVGAKEPFRDIVTYLPYIRHIHIDYPLSYPERRYPSVQDDYDYALFLNSLKQAGYDDTLTIEADIPDDWGRAYRQIVEIIG
nr:sugar phosphate isomerase/epimerase family protein [uncultured Agathobaculum sp.]